ncbi:serine/threonine-protein kinase [Streptomyces sp. RFCAC02]|uniref:serine/threonine-protein kinase n=1 Tax=Streptomyces sp. RFCAC02 TaxID=2499143 RepID=UPI001020944C|nr:serine/threonine-protein kinase [Streptomyces sp. RFCAC02]
MRELRAQDPRQIGRYRIVAWLGAGGMGQVYLGRSPAGRWVAVKVVRPELADEPGFLRRFAREVETARRVGGAFTAAVVDADPEGDPAWLATTFVAGIPLDDAIAAYGAWPPYAVRALGMAIAEALQAIHAAGVVHRDLKPSNVLLGPDGPRVIDFGISMSVHASRLTSTGALVGTPGFMSPEQLTGRAVGPPADVFALGVLLAHVASGSAPFGEGEAHGVNFRIVYEQPDLAAVPGELRGVIEACLAKEPERRPTLDGILRLLAAAPDGDAPPPPTTENFQRAGWLPAPVAAAIQERVSAVPAEPAPGAAPPVVPPPPASPPPGSSPAVPPPPATPPAASTPQGVVRPDWYAPLPTPLPLTQAPGPPARTARITRRQALFGGAAVGAAGAAALGGWWLLGRDDGGGAVADDDPTPPGEADDPSTTPGDDSAQSAPVTLTWAYPADDANQDVYDGWADEFMAEHPGVTIEKFLPDAANYDAQVTTSVAAGSGPDVLRVSPALAAELAGMGHLADLAVAVEPAAEALNPHLLDVFRAEDGGALHAVPQQAGVIGFWYRQALFEDWGVAVPETWSAFLDAVRTFRDAGVTPIALALGESWPSAYYWTYLALRTAGGEALTNAARTADFSAPAFTRAGELLQELAALDPFPAQAESADYMTGQVPVFARGEAAMELTGQWAPRYYAEEDGGADGIGFFPFPAVEDGAGSATEILGYAEGMAVSAGAPPEAAAFALFLAERPQQSGVTGTGALPILVDAADVVPDEPLAAPVGVLTAATGFQPDWEQLGIPGLSAAVGESARSVILGEATPAEAATEIGDAADVG